MLRYHQSSQSSHLKESFFRDMGDTAWFEEKSDDEKLLILARRMWHGIKSEDEWCKETFGILLKTMPVDLVSMHLLVTLGRWTDLRSTTKKKHFKMF